MVKFYNDGMVQVVTLPISSTDFSQPFYIDLFSVLEELCFYCVALLLSVFRPPPPEFLFSYCLNTVIVSVDF